jgi:hypothetical protein
MARKHLDAVAGGLIRADFAAKIRLSAEEFATFSMPRLCRYNM